MALKTCFRFPVLALVLLGLSACGGSEGKNEITTSTVEGAPRDEKTQCNDKSDKDCDAGLTKSLLNALSIGDDDDDDEPRVIVDTIPDDPLQSPQIAAIINKPDSAKTARDREIEALVNELIRTRRQRLAQ